MRYKKIDTDLASSARKKDAVTAASSIDKFFAKLGIKFPPPQKPQAAQEPLTLKQYWAKVVGKALADKTKVGQRDGVLFVRCASSAACYSLSLDAQRLLQEMQVFDSSIKKIYWL